MFFIRREHPDYLLDLRVTATCFTVPSLRQCVQTRRSAFTKQSTNHADADPDSRAYCVGHVPGGGW